MISSRNFFYSNLCIIFWFSFLIIIYNNIFSQDISIKDNGYLQIASYVKIDTFYIVINDDYNNIKKIHLNSRIKLPVGQHKITVIIKQYYDNNFMINISKDKVTQYTIVLSRSTYNNTPYNNNSYYWIKNGVNVSILTDNDSEIYIDGQWIALSSFKLDLPLGKHKIETRHKSGVKTTKKIIITSKRFMIYKMYNRVNQNIARMLTVYPGFRQLYEKQGKKGFFLASVFTAGIAVGKYSHAQYKNMNNNYLDARFYYQNDGGHNGDRVEDLYNKTKNYAKIRDYALWTAIGAYILNIIDVGFLKSKAVYRNEDNQSQYNYYSINITKNTICLNLNLNF